IGAIVQPVAAAGLGTAVVMADDREVLCTRAAGFRRPPDDAIPEGVPLDAHGYPANAAVRPHLLKVLEDRDIPFVFGHINEADTVGHDQGPESEAALTCYQQTDGLVGELLDALQPVWSQTVVIIVSDHDMEARTPTPPIDLTADPGFAELSDGVIPAGGAALVHLRPAMPHARAGNGRARVDGVASWQPGGPELLILGARPGWIS